MARHKSESPLEPARSPASAPRVKSTPNRRRKAAKGTRIAYLTGGGEAGARLLHQPKDSVGILGLVRLGVGGDEGVEAAGRDLGALGEQLAQRLLGLRRIARLHQSIHHDGMRGGVGRHPRRLHRA